MKKIYGVIGAGGHGREVMPMLRLIHQKEIELGSVELCFVIEGQPERSEINGYRVFELAEFLSIPNPKEFNVAIGDSRVRQRIAEKCIENLVNPFSMVAADGVILDGNEIGIGCMISAQTIITSNVKIGRFFHANNQCNIAHDCVIGDYVTFAPGVKCNGNVWIGNHAYIGAGALIRQGAQGKPLKIGEGATIGMGAVVVKDVLPYTTVIGNPARVMLDR